MITDLEPPPSMVKTFGDNWIRWIFNLYQYTNSGTYTPTLTNVTNLTASTAYEAQWLRIGNVVTVSGRVDADPTLAGAVQLGLSLPIAGSFANAYECAGTAVAPGVAGLSAAILADTANDRAEIQWVAVDAANRAFYFSFVYRIL